MEINNNRGNTNYLSQEFSRYLAESNILENTVLEHRINQKCKNKYNQSTFINSVNDLLQKKLRKYKILANSCAVLSFLLFIQSSIVIKTFLIFSLSATVFFILCYFQNKKITKVFDEFSQISKYLTENEINMLIRSISSQKNVFNTSLTDEIIHNAMNIEVLLPVENEYISMNFQNINKSDSDLNKQQINQKKIENELLDFKKKFTNIKQEIKTIEYNINHLVDNQKKIEELKFKFDSLGGEAIIEKILREMNDYLKEPQNILRSKEKRLKDLECRNKEITLGIKNNNANIDVFKEEEEKIREKYFNKSKTLNQDLELAINACLEYREQFNKEKLNLKLRRETLEKELNDEKLLDSEKSHLENELKAVKEKQEIQSNNEIFDEHVSMLEKNKREAEINYDRFENNKMYEMDTELRNNREKLNMVIQQLETQHEELNLINNKTENLSNEIEEINQQIRRTEQEYDYKVNPFKNMKRNIDSLEKSIRLGEEGVVILPSKENELKNIFTKMQSLNEENAKIINYVQEEKNARNFFYRKSEIF